jgi:hypothetical protein
MSFQGVLPSGSAVFPNPQPGQENTVASASGRYQLIMQQDGNLVLYVEAVRRNGTTPIWASHTNGQSVSQCVMQTDGNLVIYGFPNPIWASHTNGHDGAFLVVQDDGNMVIYAPDQTPVWATGT